MEIKIKAGETIEPLILPLTDDQQFEMWKILNAQRSKEVELGAFTIVPKLIEDPTWKAEGSLYRMLCLRFAAAFAITCVITSPADPVDNR